MVAKAEQRSEHPIKFYQHLSTKESPASGTSAHSCADTFSTLKVLMQLYQRVTYTQLPHSGHGRQRFEFVDDVTCQIEECETDLLSDNDDQMSCCCSEKDTYAGSGIVLFAQINDQYEKNSLHSHEHAYTKLNESRTALRKC